VALRSVLLLLASIGATQAGAQSLPNVVDPNGYLSKEYLQRVGPPTGILSVQHLYAVLKRCKTVAPAGASGREQAFEQLVDGAKSANGLWRTFYNLEGNVKEVHHATARAMFMSPEFPVDMRRYDELVANVPLSVQIEDCTAFVGLVSQALGAKQ
jgi:hypothetical protein